MIPHLLINTLRKYFIKNLIEDVDRNIGKRMILMLSFTIFQRHLNHTKEQTMPITVVIGAQWGDEGKGKGVDILAEKADIVARYQGGPNAGHTIWIDGQKTVLHQVPSGILHPKTRCVMGNGMVIDPISLAEEISALEAAGVPDIGSRLHIARGAHIILPLHRERDKEMEKTHHIGTTGRGIGPAYADKSYRVGFRASDILSPTFETRVRDTPGVIGDLEKFFSACETLRQYVTDTVGLLHDALEHHQLILAEGAQGTSLDVDHGTYPYVTSSNTTVGGVCTGLGVPASAITRVIGIAKAYTTRVGDGPFPTELENEIGKLLQMRGDERGATTGRTRRCGWLDLPLLRYAARVNGFTELWVTKMDVLDTLPFIQVCHQYCIDGTVQAVSSVIDCLEIITPKFVTLEGWEKETRKAGTHAGLPRAAREYLDFIEKKVGVPITQVGVGPDRAHLICRPTR